MIWQKSVCGAVQTGVVAMAALAMLCVVTYDASAQGLPGGPRLSPEESAAVWKAQAKGAAKEAGISGENEEKLVNAYTNARKAHRKAVRAAAEESRSEGEEGEGSYRRRWARLQELAAEHGAKFSKELGGFLKEDQSKKAEGTLRLFSRRWDGQVHNVLGYELDAKKQDTALGHIWRFNAISRNLRNDAVMSESDDGIRNSREKIREMKSQLDSELSKVLSEEQLASWKKSTARRGGRGGGGPGGGRPGGGPPRGGDGE